jgi:hypothetical protein
MLGNVLPNSLYLKKEKLTEFQRLVKHSNH